ncbi:MAG: hypothetical protein MN733_27025 [Nitrososphaera sp.]|nr:hypothetical protein [Nitrososphaera sp.]
MHRRLLDTLVDPVHLRPLRLQESKVRSDGNIEVGVLEAEDGTQYIIRDGIPRFVLTEDSDQLQTSAAFGFKWKRRDTYDTEAFRANNIRLSEDIPLLGIKAGKHDGQRLIYWNFAKLYWNESLSFEENVHVNFDWYRPQYAHRQTEQEVRHWCDEASLVVRWFHVQESGFSVIAVKR